MGKHLAGVALRPIMRLRREWQPEAHLGLQAFADIKTYYNDITHNNLDLIKTLKEDVAEMRKKEAQNEKLMYEIAQENKRLSEPLQKVRADTHRSSAFGHPCDSWPTATWSPDSRAGAVPPWLIDHQHGLSCTQCVKA